MALIIKRGSDGRMMGRNDPGPSLLLLSKSRRIAHRKEFQVRHYLDPVAGISVIAMKGLGMSMLYRADSSNPNAFSTLGRGGSASPKPVHYDGLLFLVTPDIRVAGSAWLCNSESKWLSGSNTFAGGKLCLGTTIDPLNLSPLDALCFNRANADLSWQGTALTGLWESIPDPATPRSRTGVQTFKIATWPAVATAPCQIPPQILDACTDW